MERLQMTLQINFLVPYSPLRKISVIRYRFAVE